MVSGEPQSPPTYRSLGAIPLERFQLAADRHSLGRVLAAEPLGGAYGNNVGLTTEQGAWVLRGAVPPLDATLLRRERFFARAVHERSSLASPWPYLVDDTESIFGWPYAIMPRLRGQVLHPALDLDWAVIGYALGRAAAELHSIVFPRLGAWSAEVDDIISPGMPAAQWFRKRATDLVRRVAETSAALDQASATLVEDVIGAAVPSIADFEPTYVHGDLGLGNLVGERSPAGFAFTGVFDLGDGYAGDPDEDLATPLWWPLYWRNEVASRAFLEAYCAERPARAARTPRLRAYVVVSLLRNWEAGQRQGFDWYGGCRTFREWALPLLEQVNDVIR